MAFTNQKVVWENWVWQGSNNVVWEDWTWQATNDVVWEDWGYIDASQWSWTAFGQASEIEIIDGSDVLRAGSELGYKEFRARNTLMKKQIKIKWEAMPASERTALLNFWRQRKGGSDAFWWPIPSEMYSAGTEYLVRFIEDTINQNILKPRANQYWKTEVLLEEVD